MAEELVLNVTGMMCGGVPDPPTPPPPRNLPPSPNSIPI